MKKWAVFFAYSIFLVFVTRELILKDVDSYIRSRINELTVEKIDLTAENEEG